MDDDQDSQMLGWSSDVSDEQVKVVDVLQICSASLSVLGSSAIIFKTLRDPISTPYGRIMLGLSSCNIFGSLTWAIDQFLRPSESGRVWAFGNSSTCQTAAFLTQFFLVAWWYNVILSYYFLLTVLSQARRKNYVGKCEVWLHLSALYFPITAIMGLHRGWYSDTYCWYKDLMIQWLIGGFPVIFIYFSLILNTIVIYGVVRRRHVDGITRVQKKLKKEAATLMFLYVAIFFLTVSPSLVEEILVSFFGNTIHDDGKLYPLTILEAMLLPLQGFLNFFIYIKPMYTRFRAANPDKPMHFVLYQALINPKAPKLYRSRAANNNADKDVGIEDNTVIPNQVLFNITFEENAVNTNLSLFNPVINI